MSCEVCRGALSEEPGRVGRINNCIEHICGCELYAVSAHSPGTVEDTETLHYLVPTPDGRTEEGYLNPTYLLSVDTEGLSVLREGADDKEFENTLEELRPRWQNNSKSLEGVMSFKVSAVRYFNETRLCCVYDTGKAHKPHHADLMAPAISGVVSNSELKRRRRQRLKLIVDQIGNNFEAPSSFRNGRLAHLAK